jgi:hypothetical protein
MHGIEIETRRAVVVVDAYPASTAGQVDSMVDRIVEIWREHRELDEAHGEGVQRMLDMGFPHQNACVCVPESAAGRGGIFTSQEQIHAYYAPMVTIHGSCWAEYRDGWIAELDIIERTRAALGLGVLEMRMEALLDEAGALSEAIMAVPVETLDVLIAKLRYASLEAKAFDPDTSDDDGIEVEITSALLRDARRLSER